MRGSQQKDEISFTNLCCSSRAPIVLGCKEHLTKRLKQYMTAIQRPLLLFTCVNIHMTTQNNTI
jgi:hypothetical protein